jgi:hypothetical protein
MAKGRSKYNKALHTTHRSDAASLALVEVLRSWLDPQESAPDENLTRDRLMALLAATSPARSSAPPYQPPNIDAL